jgi:hypothetical protein
MEEICSAVCGSEEEYLRFLHKFIRIHGADSVHCLPLIEKRIQFLEDSSRFGSGVARYLFKVCLMISKE